LERKRLAPPNERTFLILVTTGKSSEMSKTQLALGLLGVSFVSWLTGFATACLAFGFLVDAEEPKQNAAPPFHSISEAAEHRYVPRPFSPPRELRNTN